MAKETRVAGGRHSFWVVHQGQEVRIAEGSEAPSSEAREGERAIRVMGPFASKEDATKMYEKVRGRTLKYRLARERGEV